MKKNAINPFENFCHIVNIKKFDNKCNDRFFKKLNNKRFVSLKIENQIETIKYYYTCFIEVLKKLFTLN